MISNISGILYLLQVMKDQFFPADILFLASTNADGVCYIEVQHFSYVPFDIVLFFQFI